MFTSVTVWLRQSNNVNSSTNSQRLPHLHFIHINLKKQNKPTLKKNVIFLFSLEVSLSTIHNLYKMVMICTTFYSHHNPTLSFSHKIGWGNKTLCTIKTNKQSSPLILSYTIAWRVGGGERRNKNFN